MAKGQAERLMVLVQDLLTGQNLTPSDLAAVAVCTGPGNFTGIRIAVAGARGLALSLGIPAIGVSRLEALAHDIKEPVCAILDARQDSVFFQHFDNGSQANDAVVLPRTQLTDHLADAGNIHLVVALPDEIVASELDKVKTVRARDIVVNVARRAATQLHQDPPLPAPMYVRAPNAALPSDPPPTILP